jgi:hypothetical protein
MRGARRLWQAMVRAGDLKEEVLRAIMPARMRIVHYSWPLRPRVCPCDIDLCDYLRDRNIRRRSIFHFGSGGHHLVGVRNRDDGLENEVLAITASPPEHAHYVRRIIRAPSLGRHYKVLFADIYDLGPALPVFDLVTLFHLAEFTPQVGSGRRLDDAALLALLLSRLAEGGLMLFYAGSYGWARSRPLVEQVVGEGRLVLAEQWRSLLVYRRS